MWLLKPSEKMMPKRSLSAFSDSDATRSASKCCASDDDVSSLDSTDLCAEERTTVRLCALPYTTDRAKLLRILDRNGFNDKYDFVYVPIRFKTKQCLGFSFVNFTSAEVANEFRSFFDGYTKWEVKSHKIAHTDWSRLQGLEANRSHFKDHPLMHRAVEDRFKPALYHHGRRVPFPPPNKEAERTWEYTLRRRVPSIKSDVKASKPRGGERQWNANAVSFAPACGPHALDISSQIDAVLDALGC
jgi:hypothetical protein